MKGAGDGGNGIKYIGQHVFDFVSSFRNTVNIGTDALQADFFLNSISNLTSSLPADGKVLHIDSNNKIGFRTFAQLIADLGGGDITGVSVSDGSNLHDITSGNFALTFTAGPGIGLGLTGSSTGATNGELTINSDIATTSSIGVASFSSDNFAVSGAGAVTIKSGGVDLTDEVTNRLPIASGGTNADTAAGARSTLGVDAAGTDNSTNVTLAGSLDYITISGQEITRNAIDLTADVTGILPAGNVATLNQSTTGNAATATALATARNINGVSFDGTGDITVAAAGSTLSDTVTVTKGGTGTTSLTSNAILTGNGVSAIQAESTLVYSGGTLLIGTSDSTGAIIQKNTGGSGRLTIQAGNATESGVALGGDLRLFGGASCGPAAGGSIKFFSTPGGTESSGVLGTHVEIAGLDSSGTLQVDGGITTGSTSFVNSSGVIQVATQGTIDHDSLANFVAAEHYRWDTDISSTATINAANIPTLNQDTTGQAGTVATIAGLAPNTATTAAAQPNITSLGTLTALTVDNITIDGDTITASADLNIVATGNDIDIDTDNFTLESSGGNKPNFTLKSTSGGNKPSTFNFIKDKGAAGAANDSVGLMLYTSDNDAQEQTSIAATLVTVEDATDGAEEGKYSVSIKNTSSSGTRESFSLTGNGTATDAIIGFSDTSVTTITGTLTMGSTAFVNNSGVIQVATQGTIDHDSLANFVAAEHYRWDTDISSTATINAANIPTLNQSTTGNAATATALTSGNKTISGDLTTNNVFLPGGGTISFDDSLDGSDQFITGTDSNLTIDGDDKIKLRADTQIEVKSTSNTDTVIITNNSGDIYTAGNIELGHASDTTISRSAAGTVTIEGKTIATTNKTVAFFNSSFFNSSTSAFYAPFNYLFEQTSLSTASYFAMISAPYDGRVLKVSSRTQSSSSKTTTVEMYLNGDDSDLTNDQVGTDLVIGTYTSGGTGTCAADWVFSAGDALSFRVTNSASGSGQVLTFVIEFDLDT